MKKVIIHTLILHVFLLNICYLQECPPSDTLNVTSSQNLWDIPYNNNWDGLEIMTWNLRDFPISENTINDVQEIISDLLPDIINFQEIWDYNEANYTGIPEKSKTILDFL